MRKTFCLAIATLAFVSAACSEVTKDPVSLGASSPRRTTAATSDVWNIADVDAALGAGTYSLDTTQVGNEATMYFAPDLSAEELPTFCRDHFNAIDLWWDGGDGIATFHLDPPLLFVGYRPGTVKSGVLTLRRAIYETFQTSEATDPAGNVWRFTGRFNALCRGGEFAIGPIVFGGQIVRSQDPIDKPVLVRRGDTGSGGCGGEDLTQLTFSPYDDGSSSGSGYDDCTGGDADGPADDGSGTQYQPGDYTGGETVDFGTGMGNGGTSVCGATAVVEYVCIDVWNNEMGRWEEWACGYVTSC